MFELEHALELLLMEIGLNLEESVETETEEANEKKKPLEDSHIHPCWMYMQL
jgi:hypothetical protein